MLTYLIGGGVGGQGVRSPPNRNWGGTPLHVLVPKNTIADVFDNNFDISAHIFCLQTTQELPKKHNEQGGGAVAPQTEIGGALPPPPTF